MPRGAAHRDAGRVSWSQASVHQTWVPRKEPSEFIHPPLLTALVKRNYAQQKAEHVGRTSHIGTEKARQEEEAQEKAEKIRQDALEEQREAEKTQQKALEVQREAEKTQQKALEVQREASSNSSSSSSSSSESDSRSNSGSDSGSDSDSGGAAKTQVQHQTEEEPLEDTKPILSRFQAGFARDELRANKGNKGKGETLTATERATRFAALWRRSGTLSRPRNRREDAKRIRDLEAQVFDGVPSSASTMALPALLSLVERVCGPIQETVEDERVACALAQVALTARKRKLSASLKALKSDAPKRARK